MKKKKIEMFFYFSISFSNLLNDKKTIGTKLMADGREFYGHRCAFHAGGSSWMTVSIHRRETVRAMNARCVINKQTSRCGRRVASRRIGHRESRNVKGERERARERKRMASCQSHLRKTSSTYERSTLSRGVCALP